MIGPDIPLSNPDLERGLLGLLMTFSGMAQDESTKRALSIIRPRDFFTKEHRTVYAAILYLEKRALHFGMESVHAVLHDKHKLNGSLSRFDLEQMVSEGSRMTPLLPEEQALQLRALGEYRDALRAIRTMQDITATVTDPPRLRAQMREIVLGLEREALVQETKGYDLDELLALDFPPLIPVVERLVYAGTSTLVVGGSKAGKSFLMLGLALAVAAGAPALGTLATGAPRHVLYLNLDDGLRRAKDRVMNMLLSLPQARRGMFHLYDHWPTIDRGGEGMLRNWCERHPEGVVVIDLLENIRPERLGSIYASDYRAMRPISDICHETGAAALIAHHTNKRGLSGSEEFDPILAISGSMGLPGAVDGMLVFRPNKEEDAQGARLNLIHRDAPRGEYQLARDEHLNGWRFDGESLQSKIKARISPDRQAILDIIQQAAHPLTPIEIARRLGREDSNSTRQLLLKMRGAGEIVAYDNGTYQHPAEHARVGPQEGGNDGDDSVTAQSQ